MNPEPQEELLECFKQATEKLNLCPNRLWAVAREALPKLLPKRLLAETLLSETADLSLEDDAHEPNTSHDLCTFDFCENSQRDFTAVHQRHECVTLDCAPVRGRFPRDTLRDAAENGRPTAWKLAGNALLDPDRPYMAVSHVWSDGTGAGAWTDGEVNECLFKFFQDIAEDFQCEGIWWDTICIPKEKVARGLAIQKMHTNYQFARVTLVHDCFLREWEWDLETACFGILMSPWFSRGWTALELANSHKVKVAFKAPQGGLVIKDLDEDILSKDGEPDGPRKEATAIINLLRTAFRRNKQEDHGDLNYLLMALGSRHTSWPKDMSVISALLTGVEKAELVQNTYQRVLVTLRRVHHGHLFHNSATMSNAFSWCPTSLFSMPLQPLHVPSSYLAVSRDGSIHGEWRVNRMSSSIKQNLLWDNGMHALVRRRLETALAQNEHCYLLAEPGYGLISRALLVIKLQGKEIEELTRYHYVGALYFREHLPEVGWDLQTVIVAGDEVVDNAHAIHAYSNNIESQEEIPETIQQAIWRGDSTKAQEMAEKVDLEELDRTGRGVCHVAAERGDMSMVEFLAEKASSKDYLRIKDGRGQTALHRAAWAGSAIIAKFLMKGGSSAADKGNDGNLPLHIAARMGFRPVVQLLLEDDKNLIDSKGFNDLTPLHYAAMNRHGEVVRWLVETGADVNVKDRMGWTPLHYAAESGNEQVVTLLLNRGACNNVEDHEVGWTPLHFAAMNGCMGIIKILCENGANPKAKDKYGWTPGHFADLNWGLKTAELWYEGELNDALIDKSRWTPLHCLAIDNHQGLAKSLSKSGFNVSSKPEDPDWTPLLFAAANGLRTATRRLIENRDDIEPWGKELPASLAAAVENGHEAVVEILLSKGAYIDTADSLGRTPLRCATEKGHVAVVQVLVKAGADINATEGQLSMTPLGWAAWEGNEASVRLLIDMGANIHAESAWAQTPLWLAAEKNHVAIFKLLLHQGADINAQNKEGQTCLWWAAEQGREATVRLLVDHGANPDTVNIRGETPISRAAGNGHEAVVRFLIDQGVDVNACGRFEPSPMLLAATSGHTGIVKLLVDKIADVDAVNSEGRTAIGFAAFHGHDAAMRVLIEHGADMRAMDNYGMTPLGWATRHGQEVAAQLLIDEGVDVNEEQMDGRTVLWYAAEKGRTNLAALLLKSGANFEVQDEDGQTPLIWAAKNGHEAIVQLLLDYGANIDAQDNNGWSGLGWVSSEAIESVAKLLIDRGADVNLKTNDGQTALFLAAKIRNKVTKHKATMQLLIESGAEINAQDNAGRTALCFATEKGETASMQLLIDHGADVNIKDHHGRPLLWWAVENGVEWVAQVLLDNGADFNATDDDGWTPLGWAAWSGRMTIVRLLVRKGAILGQSLIKEMVDLPAEVDTSEEDMYF